jgi:hypothetical protein
MDSYYRRYPEGSIAEKVWAQGDFILRDRKTGCLDICGRSDGVLNPSGVRFGSAEIYHVSLLCRTWPPTADLARLQVLEGFSQVVLDAICVGQRRPNKDDDERVLLFVQLVEGAKLSDTLKRDISQAIRKAYSPRHVPAHIFQVDGIPCVALLTDGVTIAAKLMPSSRWTESRQMERRRSSLSSRSFAVGALRLERRERSSHHARAQATSPSSPRPRRRIRCV